MIETQYTSLQEKYKTLQTALRSLDNALVAFSGGVDSSFLTLAVLESGIPYLAVTATSPTMPARDLADVSTLVGSLNLNHRLIESGELNDPNFVANRSDRCYYCKSDLFQRLTALARQEGFAHVLDGTTTDDMTDHRPGLRAKNQFHVKSPLLEAGLNKNEIRLLSRDKGLPTWNKPASPCLSSRISYGEPILIPSLHMVEHAEQTLRNMGFETLRVRKQESTARIELTEHDMTRLLDPKLRKQVTLAFQHIGFKFVTLDLEGFQSGKLNRVIPITSSLPPPLA
ncbi:MAG: ATP-dependent sacrificial sulfur transferase LarE [Magnetococcus sp. YQC-5]